MLSNRHAWWDKRAKDNKVDKTHWRNWCVIEVAELRHELHKFTPTVVRFYKPCAMLNAPIYWTAEGKAVSSAVMSNLTKQEAYECAKGLNFLDGEGN